MDDETRLRLLGDDYCQAEYRKQIQEEQHITPQELYGLKETGSYYLILRRNMVDNVPKDVLDNRTLENMHIK